MIQASLFAQVSLGLKATPFFFNPNLPIGDIENDITVGGFFPMPNIGAYLGYTFKDNFSLQMEIIYKTEGLSFQLPDNNGDGSFSHELIEIPLLFKYHGKTKFRGFAEAGLSVKYLLSTEQFVNYNDETNMVDLTYNVSEYFNNFKLTGIIGGGIAFDVFKNFTIDGGLRLGYDITPIGNRIIDKEIMKNWSFNNIRFFHLAIFIGVGYTFR
jgi:hypothetical protein